MCNNLQERSEIERVEDITNLHMMAYHEEIGIFNDQEKWFLAYINSSFFPVRLFAGIEENVKNTFYKYIAENEIDMEFLNEI